MRQPLKAEYRNLRYERSNVVGNGTKRRVGCQWLRTCQYRETVTQLHRRTSEFNMLKKPLLFQYLIQTWNSYSRLNRYSVIIGAPSTLIGSIDPHYDNPTAKALA